MQIIHSYPNKGWKLAGMNARQDLEMRNAVVLSGTSYNGGGVSRLWVTVTDPLGNTVAENVKEIGSGWNFTLTPGMAGDYKLVVYAADQAGNMAGVSGDATSAFIVTALLPLTLEQSVTPELEVKAGGLVTYTFQMNNPNSSEIAQNVVLTSSLSQWLTPVAQDGASFAGHQLTWSPVSLAAGGRLTRTVVARLTSQLLITGTLPVNQWVDLHSADIISQSGLVSSNLGKSPAAPTNFGVAGARQPAPQPVLLMTKRVTPTNFLQPGTLLTYRIQVTNTASVTATNLVVTDVLNPALTPVSQGGASYNSANHTLTWPAASLAPGKGLTLTFTAQASSDNAVIANQAAFASSLGGGSSNPVWALPPYSLYLPALRKTSGGNGPVTSPVTPQITVPVKPAGQGEGSAGTAVPPSDWWSNLQAALAAVWRQVFGRL